MGAISNLVARAVSVWFVAGLIMTLCNLMIASMTGGFEGLQTRNLMAFALENFPFPINFIVTGNFSPLILMAQFIIFAALAFLIEARKRVTEHPLTY